MRRKTVFKVMLVSFSLYPSILFAGTMDTGFMRGVDTLWVLVSAFLVFFMQAGFGMVEAGFIRAKNACNILTKNFLDFCMASLGFFIFGYAIMFGGNNFFTGTQGWFMVNAESGADIPLYAFWLFQAVFCGAAATIVAGGVAERMKFPAYLIYSFIISSFVYPVVGHWVWGGGWLSRLNYVDFAGSSVVHAVGGFSALAGTLLLGPRKGKYGPEGVIRPIPGHSIPLASLGVFILWFGWFGFNAGSALSVGNGEVIARVAINTNLSACCGALSAMLIVWILFKKIDLSMIMNGALGGLVGITAPCAYVEPWAALIIGVISGMIVVYGVIFLDRLMIDDPVGAFPVHGLSGVWGVIAVGLFGKQSLGLPGDGLFYGGVKQFAVQLMGGITISVFIFFVMLGIFKCIDMMIGLRVSEEVEVEGCDLHTHGMEAYPSFLTRAED